MEGPLTTERLAAAVQTGDVSEVKRLLDAGVSVNSPVDSDGHTVLDVLVKEHCKEVNSMIETSAKNLPMEKEQLFETAQQSTMELVKELVMLV